MVSIQRGVLYETPFLLVIGLRGIFMKISIIIVFILSLTAFAGQDPATKIYNGYKYNTLKNAKVYGSEWLDEIEVVLERRHDFLENVSYIGEDWGNVTEFCNWSEEESEDYFNDSEVYTSTVWNKIVNKKGKTKGYILYLFASVNDCEYPRGTYIVGKDGKEVDTETLWVLEEIDLGSYLENKVIK